MNIQKNLLADVIGGLVVILALATFFLFWKYTSAEVYYESNITIKQQIVAPDTTACSCVKVARMSGANIPLGTDAEDLLPNTTPSTGNVALFSYGSLGHVAIIEAILENGFLVKEGNFEKCKVTERFVSWSDPHLRGFWASERNT